MLLYVGSERREYLVKSLNPFNMRSVPEERQHPSDESPAEFKLFFIFFEHSVAIELGASECVSNIACWFWVDRNPSKYCNTLGDGCQMIENGRAAVGFANIIDGAHGRLELL